MVPNSYVFIAFLAAVLAMYNAAPASLRPPVLLFASYVFYSYAHPPHVAWLIVVTTTAYLGARMVQLHRRKLVLGAAVALTILPLLFVKYYNFAVETVNEIGRGQLSTVDIILPIGISFYTFQAVSYVADVYAGRVPSEPRFRKVALYLALFPQILAGPIGRAGRLLPQLEALSRSTTRGLYEGGKFLVWGFFCKLVVADNIAPIVDRIVASPTEQSGGSLSIGFALYSFQIYFDFLGYTSIAIGVARLFGVRLSRNFRRPYGATSLREFWRRWHITLSSWFRDYVYVPLGGKASRGAARVGQVMTVFVLSGLWHGAALNFVAWGGVHGAAYLVEDQARKRLGRRSLPRAARLVMRPAQVVATFVTVTLAWVFFRLPTIAEISTSLQRMLLLDTTVPYGSLNEVLKQRDSIVFMFILITAICLDSCRRARAVRECTAPRTNGQLVTELMVVNWLIVTLVLFGDAGARDFIYFRF